MEAPAGPRRISPWLALRSLAWTILIPGTVTGFLPWRYFGLSDVHLDLGSPAHVVGLLAIGAGALLLLACIWEFARSGRGTLAPIRNRSGAGCRRSIGGTAAREPRCGGLWPALRYRPTLSSGRSV